MKYPPSIRCLLWLLLLALGPVVQAQVNVPIGTLQPGESVTFMYEVTINSPLAIGVTTITNVGTVSGSNFSSVNTDDPETTTANDTTVTTLSQDFDFGDAPSAAQSGFASSYPTLLANNGARHFIPGGGATLYLGAVAPDLESDGQPNTTATGDNIAGSNDEEGVTLPLAFPRGIAKNVTVNVTGSGGKLSAWIDWNRDGDWLDAGEQVATDLVVSAGANVLPITAPVGAGLGTTFARFRLSTQTGLAPTGVANDGEVEDYQITVVTPLLANAGSDQNICQGSSVGIGGAPTASGGLPSYTYSWDNAASLNDSTLANPSATPASTTTYTVTVTDANGDTAQDSVLVTVALPQTASVGGSQTICTGGTTVGLGGNTPTQGTGTWTVQSGGTGTFSPNANTPNATFTHVSGVGPITLRWTLSNPPCPNSTADVIVTVSQPPTVASVGGPQTICANTTTVGLGGNAPAVGTGSWTIVGGGTGTFNPNATTPNATFTHSSGAGPITLRWTISNPPCADSTADVVITINNPPTVASAGSDQAIPPLGTSFGLGGNTPSSGTGSWSIIGGGGTGTFNPNAATPNATFTHASGVGPITLRWTIANAPCPDSTDDVIITIQDFDFGDAPSAAQSGFASSYPTLFIDNGARHVIPGGGATLYLGTVAPDAESDGQPTATATGDDLAGADDEEGVTLPASFRGGLSETITVVVTGSGGVLNAWMDWNKDGDWNDAGEQVITNLSLAAGPHNLSIAVPSTVVSGTTFARFRLSTQSGLAPTGSAPDGEVEDYAITLAANNAPVAVGDSIERKDTKDVKVKVDDLLSNDTDADLDTLSITAVGSPLPAGATVVRIGKWVYYTPPSGSTAPGSFTYTVSDGRGGTANGTVTVTVKIDKDPSQNEVTIQNLGANTYRIRFNGIPGRTYTLEYSDSFNPPNTVWSTLAPVTVDALGQGTYDDTTVSVTRVYRTVYP